uniref:Reverse transcriptase Ty1/copia-type domain-containing protein n=1 Tax=Fagus sylvatica TaxID=28930 RepID=A0A2N9INV3_FAGSY
MQTRSKNGIFKPKFGYTAHTDYSLTEPTTYSTASKHPQWCNAMDEEFQALQKQGTWALVPAPSTKNIVGCKWVYKLKYNSDGSFSRYKARLVAKGFHQQYGVDFYETFSPVVKPPTVKLILSLAVSLNWPLRQLDVKNAFLHGTLKEEVTRSSSGLYLNQAKYAHDLLKKHNMLASKPAKSPSCPNTRLSLHEGDPLSDPHGYRSLVGALHYLTFTRPDISFSVHQTGQETLMTSVPPQAILSTLTLIPLPGQPKSNPQSLDHPQSQNIGPLPSPQAELCWIRTLLKDLGIFLSHTPILWCDNVSALAIASNPVFHARTKHIEVDFHFVQERVLHKDLEVKFVSTVDQLANIFTKCLPTQRFIDLQRNLTVSIPVIERGC